MNNVTDLDIQGRQLHQTIFLPSEKMFTLKGKNLRPEGANYFLLDQTSFSEGTCCVGNHTGHKRYLPACTICLPSVSGPLKLPVRCP